MYQLPVQTEVLFVPMCVLKLGDFTARIDDHVRTSFEELAATDEKGVQLIDSRAPDKYTGAQI